MKTFNLNQLTGKPMYAAKASCINSSRNSTNMIVANLKPIYWSCINIISTKLVYV